MAQGRQLNSLFKNSKTFTFAGADLSASTRTTWIPVPRNAKRLAIDIGWTGTGAPAGVLSIQVTNNPNAATGPAYTYTIATQPAGSAGGVILDNILTACDYIAIVYTATSGGTGAVFTDSSQAAGSLPMLIVKE